MNLPGTLFTKKILRTLITTTITVERWPHQALILPRMQAHRGFTGLGATENTLDAFRAARSQGALMFECDVRLSKDQIPMIFHDESLDRIAKIQGMVRDMSAKELQEKVGACSLEQALMDSQSPRLVNIEIKSKILIDDPLERRVCEIVRKAKAEKRVMFSSFNPMSITRLSWLMPDIPRALLVTDVDDPENNFILKNMLSVPFLKIHMLNLDARMVNDETMEIWRKKRIPISVWTVNGKEEIQRYLKMGVVSVITDSL